MAALVDSSFEDPTEGPAVGIDLGTTYSCVAVYQNGRSKVIPNEHGNHITASYVSCTDTSLVVGDDAKSRLTLHPINTVYESKRLIGRTYTEDTVAQDINYWPFTVINDNDKPKIQVRQNNDVKTFSPEEISAMVLKKMKNIAQTYLRKEIHKAVITVPAYFNETQRKATQDAARIAGLEVLRIINEPTAAAMAYGLTRRPGGDAERHVLVFDLGGGTFDVSVLVLDEGTIKVKATGGNTHLGGSDFDNRMVDKIINWFNKKHQVTTEVTTNVRTREFHRLRKACEIAKRELSEHETVRIHVERFHDDNDLIYEASRQEFVELNMDLFQKTIDSVVATLEDANMKPIDIDDVVLVGGSTRIPKIRECLQELFQGKTLNTTINPDEAIASGAAIQAAILSGDDSEELEDVVLVDITPLSLGINTQGERMLPIIPRNSLIPCQFKKTVTTTEDDQTRIDMDVYQGERALSRDNHFLGEFYIDGLLPDRRSVARIEVTFSMDANGLLTATASDRFIPTTKHTVNVDPNRVINSEDQIKKLIEEASRYTMEDQHEVKRIDTRNKLEQLAHWLPQVILNHVNELNLSLDDKRSILDKARDTSTWLTYSVDNPIEEYRARLQTLRHACRGLPAQYLHPGNAPDTDDSDIDARHSQEEDSDVPDID